MIELTLNEAILGYFGGITLGIFIMLYAIFAVLLRILIHLKENKL